MKLKHITMVILLGSSTIYFTACTHREAAFITGAAVGVVVASSYAYPHYYGHPYYYYDGRYYYGGRYRGGYYYYDGMRYGHGHYYHSGYRYYNGSKYRAEVGRHGHYESRRQYDRRHRHRHR